MEIFAEAELSVARLWLCGSGIRAAGGPDDPLYRTPDPADPETDRGGQGPLGAYGPAGFASDGPEG